ncbi:MAG: ribosome biogenesis GTP-binding protein YihA/YsxC [bacterium]|jgi:GTP-binding protein|nr:ribosome biogenesis GTP-binding protein YihA/YsxC [bacterium]
MALVIKQADFLISVADPARLPEPAWPEIVFAGRSNVGKSSLINLLLGRRALAKVSAAPGKTRLVNYFIVNETLYFVDLPGYGYAKTSQELRREWGVLIERYLLTARTRLVVQLLDIRHTPTRQDLDSLAWLCHNMVPVVVVLTKADKLGRQAQREALLGMKQRLHSLPILQILTSSVRARSGRDDLLGFLGAWLKKGHAR